MTSQVRQSAQVKAADQALASDENGARSLVGATIGNLQVTDRVKPGARWQYAVLDARDGRTRFVRGYELVRAARNAVANGLPVVMPNEPWRDEEAPEEEGVAV